MSASTRVIMARDRAQELIDKIVKMSKADGVTVTIDSGYQADVRFAANQISTAGGGTRAPIGVDSGVRKAPAAAPTHHRSEDSPRHTAGQAQAPAEPPP